MLRQKRTKRHNISLMLLRYPLFSRILEHTIIPKITRMMKKHTSLLLFLLMGLSASAQSSQGTTFWLAYMENLTLQFNDDPIFAIVLQSETAADGVIEVPATGLSIPFSLNAGEIQEVELPSAIWYSEGSDIIADKGIRVQADGPIRAAAFHYRAYFSESTHLLPESELGTEYLVANDANGCLYTDTLELIIEECLPPDPCADQPPLQILADSVVCVDSVQQFSALGPDSLILYDWQLDGGQRSDEAMPTAVYETPGLYAAVLVAVDAEGCTYSDNFAFEVEFCEPEGGCYYVFPNTFTPNGDQTNDTFGLLTNCPVADYRMRIFNRWGEEVFTTDDPQISWDGQFRGKAAPVEVYFFAAAFQKADGEQEQIQGDLNLVR
jgi:gliding motility-associated-like protein